MSDEQLAMSNCLRTPSRAMFFEIRETLPMSAVGKILYRVLRDEYAATVKS